MTKKKRWYLKYKSNKMFSLSVHKQLMNENLILKKIPGGPVVRTPHFHFPGLGLIPGQGTKIPQAVQPSKTKNPKGISAPAPSSDNREWQNCKSDQVCLQQPPSAFCSPVPCPSTPLSQSPPVPSLPLPHPHNLLSGQFCYTEAGWGVEEHGD